MNLRADLILETEQRSANPLNPRSLMRMSIIIVPSVLALIIITMLFKAQNLKSRLEMAGQALE